MPPAYSFSTHIGAAAAKQVRSFHDLADKLKMPVDHPMPRLQFPETPLMSDERGEQGESLHLCSARKELNWRRAEMKYCGCSRKCSILTRCTEQAHRRPMPIE
jgi:hypothetical protein